MKNSKRFIAGAMAFAVAAPMVSTGILAADDKTAETPVTYYNEASETPITPEWQFTVSKKIAFDADNISITAPVALSAVDGKDDSSLAEVSIDVTVASTNEYNLLLEGKTLATAGNSEKVSYTLSYGDKIMSKTETTVGTLTKTAKSITGTAKLTGLASQSGNYSDTLTYTAAVK